MTGSGLNRSQPVGSDLNDRQFRIPPSPPPPTLLGGSTRYRLQLLPVTGHVWCWVGWIMCTVGEAAQQTCRRCRLYPRRCVVAHATKRRAYGHCRGVVRMTIRGTGARPSTRTARARAVSGADTALGHAGCSFTLRGRLAIRIVKVPKQYLTGLPAGPSVPSSPPHERGRSRRSQARIAVTA